MDFQQFGVGVAGVDGFAAHGSGGQFERLARAQVTGFAAIHQVGVGDVDLADAKIELVERALGGGNGGQARVRNAIGQVLVAPGAQSRGRAHHLDAVLQQACLFILHGLKPRGDLVEVHRLARLARQLDGVGLSSERLNLPAQSVLAGGAVGDFNLVSEGGDLARTIPWKESLSARIFGSRSRLMRWSMVEASGCAGFFRGLHLRIQAAIFG